MTRHLSQEIFEQLEKRQLKGEALVNAVLHLNSCPECRSKLPPLEKKEMLKNIFDDETDEVNKSTKKRNRIINWISKFFKRLKKDSE